MVFGAPLEKYDPEIASSLLHDIGEEPISVATSNLLSRNVLSKSMRNPKQLKPGRTLKISEMQVACHIALYYYSRYNSGIKMPWEARSHMILSKTLVHLKTLLMKVTIGVPGPSSQPMVTQLR